MLTTPTPIPQNSLMPPPADVQLSQAYRAAQVEAAGLTARAASSCSVGGPIQSTPTADAISIASGTGAIITDDDIASAPIVTVQSGAPPQLLSSLGVSPAGRAIYQRQLGVRARHYRQQRGRFGNLPPGGPFDAPGGGTGTSAIRNLRAYTRELIAGQSIGDGAGGAAAGATAGLPGSGGGAVPMDWTTAMSYTPEPGTGEPWDPPGQLQPAAGGLPGSAPGPGGSASGGAGNPYSPVSNFPGTGWGVPSTSGPGRCGNPGGWHGLSWWAKALIVVGGGIVVYKAANGR